MDFNQEANLQGTENQESNVSYETLVHEAWDRLWPNKDFSYVVVEEYNQRLGKFNANISLYGRKLTLKYNLQWKHVDNEIQIGLIQHLLIRMFAKTKADKHLNTFNINLYNNFSKQIPVFVSEDHNLEENCEFLRASFNRMNAKFFDSELNECPLKWGRAAFRKLASYNFNDDSIIVSSVFKDAPEEVLDFLMYHEMLHKHLQFDCKGGRVHAHTPEFRRRENLYPNKKAIETKINQILRKGKIRLSNVPKNKSFAGSILKKLQDYF